ncbi:MAG: hypothetical protein GWN93_06175 [Deltaproteobacteria bacterium]|nr:hypothetical protein [Deltaproteobacteria bacterium]
MSELIKDVEKLDVKPGGVLLVKVADTSISTIEAVRGMAEEISSATQCMVVILGPDDCLTNLDADVMATYGWVRKGAE